MKRISLVAGMLWFGMAAHAQKSAYPGSYNGSKMEIAQEIMILPDGRFLFSLSYGAVDQLIAGKWTEAGGKLSLKEEKAAMDPFIVFGRHNSAAEKGRLFTFKGYDRNTSIAVSFDDAFDAGSFQLLHLRDQSTFSRSNSLNVTSRPVNKFFLSKPLSKASTEDNNSIYAFSAPQEWNDFILYYNPEAETPPLSFQAVLKNDSLFLGEEGSEGNYFGVKKQFPDDFNPAKFDRYFSETGVPDSLSLSDTAGNKQIYKQLKAGDKFKSTLTIPDHEAYFKSEDRPERSVDGQGNVTIDQVEVTPIADMVVVPPPPAAGPEKKATKKTTKKTVKKKAH